MAKNLIQDVVLPKRKRARVAPELPKKTERSAPPHESFSARLKKDSPPHPHIPRRTWDWWKNPAYLWSLGILIVVLGGIFVLSAFFSGASVEVTPRQATFPVNAPFLAQKGSASSIPFEIVMVKGMENKTVPATGTKEVEKKASGKIVVYNNYSSAPQKLVRSTRFEATSGKIYRILSDIVVPGISQKNGESIPGSIEVTIYADQSGPAYNSGLTDFTIPGFKGDPRYDKFYGRSKTEITGGFSGMAPVAADKDTAKARASLESSLKEDLLREISAQVPEGYVFYRDAAEVEYEEVANISTSTKEVMVGERGTMVGVLLKKDGLLSALDKNVAAAAKDNLPFSISNPENLTFVFRGGISSLSPETKEIPFTLSGNVSVVYTVDTGALSGDLAGKAKSDFQNILSRYQAVYKAKIVYLRPFWTRYFPGQAAKIEVTIAK